MSTSEVKPFLITKNDGGEVKLTVREVRRNSQDYPWVVSTVLDPTFGTAGEARAYAVEHYGAKTGEFATK